MEEQEKRSNLIRRSIKAVFIVVAFVLFLGTLILNRKDSIAAIMGGCSVLFGLMGAGMGAILARSFVKIQPPSNKLLVIVCIGCVSGFAICAALSGVILRIAFALSILMGIIAVIVNGIGYLFVYGATILTLASSPFAASPTIAARDIATDSDPFSTMIRDSLESDKTGVRRAAFAKAVADTAAAQREQE